MNYLERLVQIFPNGKTALEIALKNCPGDNEGPCKFNGNCSLCWMKPLDTYYAVPNSNKNTISNYKGL